ncbi:MAG: transglycosylase domain-containing protein [SAR324 cluster bacterium]|uniref:Transglycosylase domain-containing protein n=1 Tax=SAR324 cluster bacterium TaxID=2024889 RepID=A0A7X9FTK3_9DELT|nr:transglycosylase domain-containing protein [SAR324 cluster bacterium]
MKLFQVLTRYCFKVDVSALRGVYCWKSWEGSFIADIGFKTDTFIPLEAIPPHLILLVILHEDQFFFTHGVLNWTELRRLIYDFLLRKAPLMGGSSITQQLAKFLFTSRERSISRKIREIIIAYGLEEEFSKEEILALYLNTVGLGRDIFGIHQASERYFKKTVSELSVDESMFICSLIRQPTKRQRFAMKPGNAHRFDYEMSFLKYFDFFRISLIRFSIDSLINPHLIKLDQLLSFLKDRKELKESAAKISKIEHISIETRAMIHLDKLHSMISSMADNSSK